MVFYFEGEVLTEKQYFDKLYIKILERENRVIREEQRKGYLESEIENENNLKW